MTDNSEEAEVKITDFGLSKVFDDHSHVMQTPCGTPGYIAPEVLLMRSYCRGLQSDHPGALADAKGACEQGFEGACTVVPKLEGRLEWIEQKTRELETEKAAAEAAESRHLIAAWRGESGVYDELQLVDTRLENILTTCRQ